MSLISQSTVWLKDLKYKTQNAKNYYLRILEKTKSLDCVTDEELENHRKWNIEHFEVYESMMAFLELDKQAEIREEEIIEGFMQAKYPGEVQIMATIILGEHKAPAVFMQRLAEVEDSMLYEETQHFLYLLDLLSYEDINE